MVGGPRSSTRVASTRGFPSVGPMGPSSSDRVRSTTRFASAAVGLRACTARASMRFGFASETAGRAMRGVRVRTGGAPDHPVFFESRSMGPTLPGGCDTTRPSPASQGLGAASGGPGPLAGATRRRGEAGGGVRMPRSGCRARARGPPEVGLRGRGSRGVVVAEQVLEARKLDRAFGRLRAFFAAPIARPCFTHSGATSGPMFGNPIPRRELGETP